MKGGLLWQNVQIQNANVLTAPAATTASATEKPVIVRIAAAILIMRKNNTEGLFLRSRGLSAPFFVL